jgi:hypothetical protein
MGAMRLVVDGGGRRFPTEASVDQLPALLAGRENRLWLDISDPGEAEVELLRRQFGFHELTLDEMIKPHERPRCDAHNGYYFIVVYAAESSAEEFGPRELNLFWGANYLVTIHRRPAAVMALLEDARRRWEQHEGRETYGVACLAYTLFESLVDGYFVVETAYASGSNGSKSRSSRGSKAPRPTSSGSARSCSRSPVSSPRRAGSDRWSGPTYSSRPWRSPPMSKRRSDGGKSIDSSRVAASLRRGRRVRDPRGLFGRR